MKRVKTYGDKGWRGKILQVDLSNGEIREEGFSEELKKGYIGGAGVNARLFYNLVSDNPELDPLSPENPLIFGCGPCGGDYISLCHPLYRYLEEPLNQNIWRFQCRGRFRGQVEKSGL